MKSHSDFKNYERIKELIKFVLLIVEKSCRALCRFFTNKKKIK